MTKEEYSQINLPDSPGVYQFLDEFGNILYIGKATSLKDRTKSYFSKDLIADRGLKVYNMVLAAKDIKYTITNSVLEALLLENVLIKKHQPMFNTKEKDNKTYYCVVITKEDFPRVLSMRIRDYEKRFVSEKTDVNLDVDKVHGPFVSGTEIREVLKMIRKIFPFRDRCEINQTKPCFNAQLKLCPGTCVGLITKEDYKKNIKYIKDLFDGKGESIRKELEINMIKASDNMNFELAARLRDSLYSINHIKDVALIKDDRLTNFKDRNYRIESFDVAHISGTSRVGVMCVVIGGKKETSEYKKFKLEENLNNDYAGIREMLERRFNHKEWGIPDLIVIDGGEAQRKVALDYMVNNNPSVQVASVVKDDKHKAKAILGPDFILKDKILQKAIILANSEAHRFAIKYHKDLRAKTFLK